MTELVIVGAPPADPAGATTWITDLAARAPARRAIGSGPRHRAAIVPWWWNICQRPDAVRRHSEVRLDRLP